MFRYLADPEFKAELRRRQGETLSATVSALAGMSGEAVEALRKVMMDPEASHSDRRQAAVEDLFDPYDVDPEPGGKGQTAVVTLGWEDCGGQASHL